MKIPTDLQEHNPRASFTLSPSARPAPRCSSNTRREEDRAEEADERGQGRTPNARKQRPPWPPVTSRPHIRASLKSRGRARAAGSSRGLPRARPHGLPISPQGSRGTCAPLSPSHRKRVQVLLRIPLRPTEGSGRAPARERNPKRRPHSPAPDTHIHTQRCLLTLPDSSALTFTSQ